MLISCASIITHKNPNEHTSTPTLTTPMSEIITTVVTTPPWSTQTGNHVVNSHSGYVMTNIYEKTLTDKDDNTLISAKILSPEVHFYDNESLQLTVNSNLLTIFHEIENKVNTICSRYSGSDPSSFLSTPHVFVDYSLEYFTKEAMSIRFQINETDSNANTYTSFICYNLDLTTGSVINCASLFKNSDLSAVSDRISQKLKDNGYPLYADSSRLIKQFLQNRWFISFEKLNLCFNPGEIAAVSEGAIEIYLDFNDISDLLSQYGSALFTVNYENN